MVPNRQVTQNIDDPLNGKKKSSKKNGNLGHLGTFQSKNQGYFEGPPRMGYYTHVFRDSYGSGMGIVWETYHKGVPLLGVPENLTEKTHVEF